MNYPVDTTRQFSMVKIKTIYVYEFIADYLDEKKTIVEQEAGVGSIKPFYENRMVEGDPRNMVRSKIDHVKIANLERVFSGFEGGSLPPIALKRVSTGYLVINGMHRFTMCLLYRCKEVAAKFE